MQNDKKSDIENNPSANRQLKAADSLQKKGSIYLALAFAFVPIIFFARSFLHSSLHIWLFVLGAIISMSCVVAGVFMVAEGARNRRNTIRGWIQPQHLSQKVGEIKIALHGLKTSLVQSLVGSVVLFILCSAMAWLITIDSRPSMRTLLKIDDFLMMILILLGMYAAGVIFISSIRGLWLLKFIDGGHVVINDVGLKIFIWLVSGNSPLARKTLQPIYLEIPWEKIVSFEVLSLESGNRRSENPWYKICVADLSDAYFIERRFFFGGEKQFLEILSKHLRVQISIQDDLRG